MFFFIAISREREYNDKDIPFFAQWNEVLIVQKQFQLSFALSRLGDGNDCCRTIRKVDEFGISILCIPHFLSLCVFVTLSHLLSEFCIVHVIANIAHTQMIFAYSVSLHFANFYSSAPKNAKCKWTRENQRGKNKFDFEILLIVRSHFLVENLRIFRISLVIKFSSFFFNTFYMFQWRTCNRTTNSSYSYAQWIFTFSFSPLF